MTTYIDNPLNDYDNYTYNWKIKIFDLTSGNANQGYVISHSGVENEISIENVTQETRLAFVEPNRSGVANYFKIDLKEPNGLSLFTRIRYAANRLGIPNHLEAGYELTLTITGRNPDSKSTPNNNIFTASWITKCYAINHQFVGTESNYVMYFIEQLDTAYETQDFLFQENVSITSVGTLGDFAAKLQESLNQKSVEMTRRNRNKILPTQYEIKYPSNQNSWKFSAVENDSGGAGRYVSTNGDGTLNFEFPEKTQITQMMEIAALHTVEWRRIPTNEGGFVFPDDGASNADPRQLAKLALWLRFDPKVEYIEYDALARQYQRKLTYEMITYISPEIITDVTSHSDLTNNTALQKIRLKRILGKNLLKKKYDYFFTGLNTEVIDLKIELNNAYYTMSSIVVGNGSDETFLGNPSDLNQIARLASAIAVIQNEIINVKSQIENFVFGPGFVDSYRQLTEEFSRLTNEINEKQQQLEELNRNFSNNSLDRLANAEEYISQSDLIELGNFDPYSVGNKFSYEAFESLATDGPDKGFEGEAGAVRLGAVEFTMNGLKDLLNIDMLIRGDPYWLGVDHDHFQEGGPGFFLNVNIPTYDENTETTAIPNPDWNITGVYRVLMITSVYQDGMWTMTLSGYRDKVTNIAKVYEDLQSGTVVSDSELRRRFSDELDIVNESITNSVRIPDEVFDDVRLPPLSGGLPRFPDNGTGMGPIRRGGRRSRVVRTDLDNDGPQ